MSRLFRAAGDNANDVLAAVAASAYFLGFFVAVHAALAKLTYQTASSLKSAFLPPAANARLFQRSKEEWSKGGTMLPKLDAV